MTKYSEYAVPEMFPQVKFFSVSTNICATVVTFNVRLHSIYSQETNLENNAQNHNIKILHIIFKISIVNKRDKLKI